MVSDDGGGRTGREIITHDPIPAVVLILFWKPGLLRNTYAVHISAMIEQKPRYQA